jgi:hypothetical protein
MHNFHSSPNIIRMIKSRRMRRAFSAYGREEECIQDFGGKYRRKETSTKK